MSSLRIGFCALQIGHQVAWIATKIGLPAFCAAANAASSKGCGPVARAGEITATPAPAAAIRTERRVSMKTSLAKQCGTPSYRATRRQQRRRGASRKSLLVDCDAEVERQSCVLAIRRMRSRRQQRLDRRPPQVQVF